MLFSTYIILVGSHDTISISCTLPVLLCFRTRESFPLVSFFFLSPPFFFFLLTHFVDVISLFFPSLFHVLCVCVCVCVCIYVVCDVCALCACTWEKERMRVCMYLNASVSVNPYRVVIVLPYYMHSYVFFFLSRMLYHYVCVFQSCYSDRKKGVGAERGKEQGRSICV